MAGPTQAELDKQAKAMMDLAEDSRQESWVFPSFLANLFAGRLILPLIHPFPDQDPEDKKIGDEFLAKVEAFMHKHSDAEKVDQTREIPQHVIDGLAELGCFGLKISKEYGGLGLSQYNYNRTIALVGNFDGSLGAMLSAHQSIGVPQPLKLFGTDEQKKKYLPRLAKGAISAFALTEPDVGSDPAKMGVTATPIEDGKYYLINGDKLWITNGTRAELMIVMTKTPDAIVNGKKRTQITAFVVDTKMPGFEVVHRCEFMGMSGMYNGLLRFNDVKVPAENIVWGLGKGLKLALTTLNTGRLSLPWACLGSNKLCLQIVRTWGNERVQWGAPIGKHDFGAEKISDIASDTYAMEAMVRLTTAMADSGKLDIRLEAAMLKVYASEQAWKAIDETIQLRGGRGYEKSESLRARGEKAIPIERMMRDMRVNRILEGSTEVMQLFVAREALDIHLKVAGDLIKPGVPIMQKAVALVKTVFFYAHWYPNTYLGWSLWPRYSKFGKLGKHLRYVNRTSRKLARTTFHNMVRFGPGLEKRQRVLGRIVEIGTELFAISASCSKAHSELSENPGDRTPELLADMYARRSRLKIKRLFRDLSSNEDKRSYDLALDVLDGKMKWLEEGLGDALRDSGSSGKTAS